MATSPLALITGASSGIGKEFALVLAAEGYNLALVARDKTGLENVRSQILKKHDVQIQVIDADLAQLGAVDHVWSQLQVTPLVVINNAGIGDFACVIDADPVRIETMLQLNIVAMTRLAQLAAIAMVPLGRGRILNTASIAAFFPGPTMAAYYASKSYVLSFSEALSEELKGSGVTVTALCPGPTESSFKSSAHADANRAFKGTLPSAYEVALFGYRQMTKGKVIAVHGTSNKLLVFIVRFLPRKVVRSWVKRAQQ